VITGETCHCDGPPHYYDPSWCREGKQANGKPIDLYFGMHPSPGAASSSPAANATARWYPPASTTKKVRLTTKNITDIAASHGDILSKGAALDIIRQIEDTL
jgi:hypothetical protein